MDDQNYKTIPAKEFIKIIEGLKDDYKQPRSNSIISSQRLVDEALRASGQEPIYDVYFPSLQERDQYLTRDDPHLEKGKEEGPHFNGKHTFKFNEPIRWNRGMNIHLGHGSKPALVDGIDITNVEFHQTFSIIDVWSNQSLTIHNCKFTNNSLGGNSPDGELIISASQLKKISLSDISSKSAGSSTMLRTIKIKNVSTDSLLINNVEVDGLHISCEENTILKLEIYNSKINTLTINGNEYNDVQISELEVHGTFSLSSQFKNFELIGMNPLSLIESNKTKKWVRQITFRLSSQTSKGKYVFRNANISKLAIYGINNSSVLFKSSCIGKLEFEEFTNIGDVNLHNINGVYELTIKDSSLGKAELLDVDLKHAQTTQINQSNIMDIIMIDTTFSEKLTGKSDTDYKSIRDTFRQLKFASGKQGNRIQELRYEALEMDAYSRDETSAKTLSDRFILWSNSWSNSHGQDPLKALSRLIWVTAIPFAFIKLCQGSMFDASYFFHSLNEFINFSFNPLHDYSKVFYPEQIAQERPVWSDFAKFLDTISKLLSGYLIFQFLRAFRKFVK